MLAVMARGDEVKTADKANYACKSFDITTGPLKKQMAIAAASASNQKPKQEAQKKDYGVWGPIFKDKNTFSAMHHC